MMVSFIIARTYREAMTCARIMHLYNWRHVHDPEQMYGYTSYDIFVYADAPIPEFVPHITALKNVSYTYVNCKAPGNESNPNPLN